MIPITLVGILPCTGAFHIRDQDNNKYHCMNCHIYSIAYHRDTNFHIKGLSKNFEFALRSFQLKQFHTKTTRNPCFHSRTGCCFIETDHNISFAKHGFSSTILSYTNTDSRKRFTENSFKVIAGFSRFTSLLVIVVL